MHGFPVQREVYVSKWQDVLQERSSFLSSWASLCKHEVRGYGSLFVVMRKTIWMDEIKA